MLEQERPAGEKPSVLTAFFSFVLSMSDVVFGIASGLVFIGAALLLFLFLPVESPVP